MDRSRLHVTYERRSGNDLHGRFGGGWQWKLGFQAGGRSVIVNLLVANVRLTFGGRTR